MTPAQAILIAAVLIGASIIVARAIAPYEIAPGVDGQGNPLLWRANAITGDVQLCPAINVLKHVEPKCQ
jgi:hypothetical protein